jgi:glycosyltransferase involved in cell wall biosynthesis
MKFKVFSMLEKLAGRLSTKNVCVSEHDFFEGIRNGWIKKEKACIIHNGIAVGIREAFNLRNELQISEEIPILAAVERLQEPKDPLFTIRTAAHLKRMGYSFKLLIIGDGIMRKDCENLIHHLKLEEQVLLLGTCNNVRDILQSVDISLLFSKFEGLPISIIEAMFAGKPVIASNVGGIPELITHGRNGFLLDDFNEIQAAEYIVTLLNNRDLREKFGNEGKKIANEKYSLDEMVTKYRELYALT